MKITMLVLNDYMGDARVHKEASSLANAGHDVMVLALHRSGLPTKESIGNYYLLRLKLKTRKWRGGIIMPAIKYLELIKRVWEETKKRPADVYHSHNSDSLLALYPAVRRDKAVWIYDSHELETGRNFMGSSLAPFYRWLWPLPERMFIKKVDRVISVNKSCAMHMCNLYGIEEPLILLNSPPYKPPIKSNRIRESLNISPDRKILLYQGRISHNRGLEPSIRSLKYVDFPVDLVIVGDGETKTYFEQIVSNLGLNERVHFIGFIPPNDLNILTASADIGLVLIQYGSLSYYYSLPNKLFEYLMAGVPVIGSDFPEISRIINKYQVGEVVTDPSSPKEIAASITTMIKNQNQYHKMVKQALKAAKEQNWNQEEGKLLDLYISLNSTKTSH